MEETDTKSAKSAKVHCMPSQRHLKELLTCPMIFYVHLIVSLQTMHTDSLLIDSGKRIIYILG